MTKRTVRNCPFGSLAELGAGPNSMPATGKRWLAPQKVGGTADGGWHRAAVAQIFGDGGEDGGPGLLVALRAFLREFPEWSVVYHTQANHGLTVISRDPQDKPALPGRITMAANLTRAVAAHVADGLKKVDTAGMCLQKCSPCICLAQIEVVYGRGSTVGIFRLPGLTHLCHAERSCRIKIRSIFQESLIQQLCVLGQRGMCHLFLFNSLKSLREQKFFPP